ncbi:hypothetical protein KKG41_07070 [Patescibacteria group bacterium]|nr:hypothetical protein [Patescibacteria group bacterium]MBU1891182.1 hypothetical protein [Patescibacteria group bacterium]MBU2101249.1 hypothetical protein [Patescibacteria group bacterium]
MMRGFSKFRFSSKKIAKNFILSNLTLPLAFVVFIVLLSGIVRAATFSGRVGADGDDGRTTNDATFSASTRPAVGRSASYPLDVWLRFPNVTVPQGATITSANLSFTYYSYSYDATDVFSRIYAVAEDNHTAPTDLSTWSTDHGILTTAWKNWNFTPAAEDKTTGDMVDVIQEIISRPGWSSGNAIGIQINDNGSAATTWYQWKDYEGGGSTQSSLLTINYNTPAVASNVSVDSGASSIALTEGTTKNVVCSGTVTDADGYADITSVEARFYRVGVGVTASDDLSNHYTVLGDSNCVPSGGSGTTETYTCTFPVQFYADPTDVGSAYESDTWRCWLSPTDTVGQGTAGLDSIEMNTLIALDVTSSISYGTLNLGGDTGTTDKTTIITNTGNRQIDVQLDGYGAEDGDGYAMTCQIGSIPINYETFSLSASTAYASKTKLSDTASTQTSFNLTKGAASTKNIYWGLGIPSTGSLGACSGKVNFTAISG